MGNEEARRWLGTLVPYNPITMLNLHSDTFVRFFTAYVRNSNRDEFCCCIYGSDQDAVSWWFERLSAVLPGLGGLSIRGGAPRFHQWFLDGRIITLKARPHSADSCRGDAPNLMLVINSASLSDEFSVMFMGPAVFTAEPSRRLIVTFDDGRSHPLFAGNRFPVTMLESGSEAPGAVAAAVWRPGGYTVAECGSERIRALQTLARCPNSVVHHPTVQRAVFRRRAGELKAGYSDVYLRYGYISPMWDYRFATQYPGDGFVAEWVWHFLRCQHRYRATTGIHLPVEMVHLILSMLPWRSMSVA